MLCEGSVSAHLARIIHYCNWSNATPFPNSVIWVAIAKVIYADWDDDGGGEDDVDGDDVNDGDDYDVYDDDCGAL